MDGNSYLKQINSIDGELKRINKHTKDLKAQKSRAMVGLHQYMVNHDLAQVGTGKNVITLKKCESQLPNRPKKATKPKAQKKAEAINLFKEIGIPNPESFYHEFEKTQKPRENSEEYSNKKVKRGGNAGKKNDGFDPSLGF